VIAAEDTEVRVGRRVMAGDEWILRRARDVLRRSMVTTQNLHIYKALSSRTRCCRNGKVWYQTLHRHSRRSHGLTKGRLEGRTASPRHRTHGHLQEIQLSLCWNVQ
jgi:hypothetical protein